MGTPSTQSIAMRASALCDVRRWEDARAMLRAHLAITPDDKAALTQLTRAEYGAANYEAAIEAAYALRRLAPGDEYSYRMAALSLGRQHLHAGALAEIERALALAPNLWRAYVARVSVDAWCKSVGDVTERAAREAVRLAPHEADAHAWLGYVLMTRKQWSDADNELREALRLDPQHTLARHEFARLEMRHGRLGSAAVGFAEVAARSRPGSKVVGNLLASIYRMIRVVDLLAVFAFSILWWSPRGRYGATASVVRLVWIVSAILLFGFIVIVRRQLGSRASTVVRAVASVSRPLVLWAAALVAAFLTLGVAAFTPGGVSLKLQVFGSALVVAAIVLRYVAGRSVRSAQGRRRRSSSGQASRSL